MCVLYKIVCDGSVLSKESITEDDILHWEKVDDKSVGYYLSINGDLISNGHYCETTIDNLGIGIPITYIIDIEHEFYTYINNKNVRRFINLFNLDIG